MDIGTFIVLITMHPDHSILLLDDINPVLHLVTGLLGVANVLEVVAKLESLVDIHFIVEDVACNGSIHTESLLSTKFYRLGTEVTLFESKKGMHLGNKRILHIFQECIKAFDYLHIPRSTDLHVSSEIIHIICTDDSECFSW